MEKSLTSGCAATRASQHWRVERPAAEHLVLVGEPPGALLVGPAGERGGGGEAEVTAAQQQVAEVVDQVQREVVVAAAPEREQPARGARERLGQGLGAAYAVDPGEQGGGELRALEVHLSRRGESGREVRS